MAEKLKNGKESGPERLSRLYRNFNAVGAVALAGIGILVPPTAPLMFPLAGLNVLQAGGGELARRAAKKKRKKKSKEKESKQ